MYISAVMQQSDNLYPWSTIWSAQAAPIQSSTPAQAAEGETQIDQTGQVAENTTPVADKTQACVEAR